MKRNHVDSGAEDKYGHWWIEIDGTESYGWWPAGGVGMWDALTGTDGILNGRGHFPGGTVTTDPHHGESADEEFHPAVADDDPRGDGEIANCLRQFANSYSGSWRWTFGAGQNCHTFQESAMRHCGLQQP